MNFIPDFIDGDTIKAVTIERSYSITTSGVVYVPTHQGNNVFLLWFTTRYLGNVNGDYIYPANLTPLRFFIYSSIPTYYRYQPWTDYNGSAVGASIVYSSNARYDSNPIPIMLWAVGIECNFLLASGDTSATVWINLHYGYRKKKNKFF